MALAASRNGRIAVVGAEGSVTLLSADGAVEHIAAVSRGGLAVAWSPHADRFAVGSVDGVDVLDGSGEVIGGHRGGWCSALAWSVDGTRLAAGVGRTLVVLNPDGTQRWTARRDSTVTGVAWVKSRVATAAYGGVFLHDRSPAVAPDVMAFTGSLLSLSISPNRRWAASGNQDATLHVWGVGRRGEELSMAGYPSKISALEFSPDSSLLASGGAPDVTVWDFTAAGPRGSTPRILEGHQQVVTAVAWSPDGDLLAGSGADGRVAVWRPPRAVPGSPAAAVDLMFRDSPATAVGWDRAGRLLAGWADSTVVAHVVGGA
ncbi:hypothetical protein TUM20985_39040 [Mycobacterium antarcticum]|uniref:WD40 repeat domain-containing protein n=1 Tax=unclassified Mycolicibacterium TaxID=2636767 RepID=UPI00238BEE9E|nr:MULTISPECIES: hypothetical protein [unclassified Mycolicibacterium]BDX33357.1 hypothetical protein TUM20985_39040 [Mycolicibacterium sp. TUM20985]GLP83072.1 hypothetical protein TUM20984_44920 [Mycolicibacterium sp. TUM20984]